MARHVLIVDDDPDIRSLAAVVLEAAGYEVTAAPDAETALDMVKRRRPDLVLADLNLPGMDGRALARKLAKMKVPVLAYTGSDEAKLDDFAGAVPKGTSTEGLKRAVRAALGDGA